jgi:hypothetical protein
MKVWRCHPIFTFTDDPANDLEALLCIRAGAHAELRSLVLARLRSVASQLGRPLCQESDIRVWVWLTPMPPATMEGWRDPSHPAKQRSFCYRLGDRTCFFDPD